MMEANTQAKSSGFNPEEFVNNATGNEHLNPTIEEREQALREKEGQLNEKEEDLNEKEKGALAAEKAGKKLEEENEQEEEDESGNLKTENEDDSWLKGSMETKEEEEESEENKSEENKGGDETKSTPAPEAIFQDLSKELGIEFKDKAQFVNAIKSQITTAQTQNSEPVAKIDKILSLPPRERIKEWAKVELEMDEAAAESHVAKIEKQGDEFLDLKDSEIVSSLKKDRNLVVQSIQQKQDAEKGNMEKATKGISTAIKNLEKTGVFGIPVKEMKTEIEKFHKLFELKGVKGFGVRNQEELEVKFFQLNRAKIISKIATTAARIASEKQGEKDYKEFIEKKLLNKSLKPGTSGSATTKKSDKFNADDWSQAAETAMLSS